MAAYGKRTRQQNLNLCIIVLTSSLKLYKMPFHVLEKALLYIRFNSQGKITFRACGLKFRMLCAIVSSVIKFQSAIPVKLVQA